MTEEQQAQLKPLDDQKALAPFMPVADGYGYLGTILYDEKSDRIQCHICGELFKTLRGHLRKIHNTSTKEYKIKYDLNMGTGLNTPSISEQISRRTSLVREIYYGEKSPEEIRELARKMAALSNKTQDAIRKETRTKRRYSIETMNKFGTCPAQIEERFIKIYEKLEHTPSFTELYREDASLLSVLCRRFKGYKNALAYFGLSTKRRVTFGTYGLDQVKLELDKFVHEQKRLPLPKDTKMGLLPDYQTLVKYFGNWQLVKEYSFERLEKEYPHKADEYNKKLIRIHVNGVPIIRNIPERRKRDILSKPDKIYKKRSGKNWLEDWVEFNGQK